MKALRWAALVLLTLGVAFPVGAAAKTPPKSPRPARTAPAHLLVYAQEWTLYGSRASVPAGTIDVELWNRGQDAHDVTVRRLSGKTMTGPVLARVPVTQSGQISRSTWHLKAGRYELYCSLPGHLAMGMHFVLTVT